MLHVASLTGNGSDVESGNRRGVANWFAAVIEETSYWALVHPPGKADFHHADSFAVEFSKA
jgi:hypothetical protein